MILLNLSINQCRSLISYELPVEVWLSKKMARTSFSLRSVREENLGNVLLRPRQLSRIKTRFRAHCQIVS